MGGQYNELKRSGEVSKADLRKEFEKLQDEDRYENGHSYSGGMGMAAGLEFRDNHFATEDEAHEWLVDNAKKWEAALVITYGTEKNWMIGAWCSS